MEQLIKEISIQEKFLKNKEILSKKEKIEEITNNITDLLNKYKSTIDTNSEFNQSLNALSSYYQSKPEYIKSLAYMGEKGHLIEKTIIQKYSDEAIKAKKSIAQLHFSDYEELNNPETNEITEIINICNKIIKSYDNYDLYRNNRTNQSNIMSENIEYIQLGSYINILKEIIERCEKLKISRSKFDLNKIRKLQHDITTIDEEINKIMPKYRMVQSSLEKNKIEIKP